MIVRSRDTIFKTESVPGKVFSVQKMNMKEKRKLKASEEIPLEQLDSQDQVESNGLIYSKHK